MRMKSSTLNNDAACLVQQEKFYEALIMLSTALDSLKRAIQDDTWKRSFIHPSSSSSSSSSSSRQRKIISSSFSLTFLSSSFIRDSPTSRPSHSSQDTAARRPYLFQAPIYIQTNNVCSWCYHKSIETVSYAIVYNLALCHHMSALYDHDIELLQRTVKFYKNAKQLLLAIDETGVNWLHALAISNNMGHAYHLLCDESASQVYFQRLLNLIVYIIRESSSGISMDGPPERIPVLLSIRHGFLDGFLRNVMHLMGSPSCVAPAA